jgi:hypothetical protein
MAFAALRENKATFVAVCLLIGVPGLFLGPLLMTPAYRELQPALGGMTLTAVEMLFAFLIDFPLAVIASAIICRAIRSSDAADGALAGAFFLALFVLLILACLLLGGVFAPIGVLALSEVFPVAVAAAGKALGRVTLAVLLIAFLVFDFALCALGGVAGYHFAGLFRRREADRTAG